MRSAFQAVPYSIEGITLASVSIGLSLPSPPPPVSSDNAVAFGTTWVCPRWWMTLCVDDNDDCGGGDNTTGTGACGGRGGRPTPAVV